EVAGMRLDRVGGLGKRGLTFGNRRVAAATAASRSPASAYGAAANMSPVAGLRTSRLFSAATARPSIVSGNCKLIHLSPELSGALGPLIDIALQTNVIR